MKTFAAAVLALLVALWLDLPRPYWAMATVYITSQPLAGATRSKAFFRVLGTVIGAAMTLVALPNLVDAPELLCLAIALWVGLCLYLSLLDGTPRGYTFMLGGYTLALIGFPAVADPGSIFDIAVARVEEITLGIVCATLVSTLVLPRSVGPAVATRIEGWLTDARRLSADVLLRHGTVEARRAARLKLATDAVEIETLASHITYDNAADGNAVRGLRALHGRMLMLLPLLASIGDRLTALGAGWRTARPQLARLTDEIARWVATDNGERSPPDILRDMIAELKPTLDASSPWDDILVANLLIRLRDLVDLSHDCRALERAIAAGDDVTRVPLSVPREDAAGVTRHRDHGLALWSAAGAALVILVCCAFWIFTGWADGASAPMMAAVACSFFAGQDDPVPSIRGFAVWAAVSIVVVGLYLFAVLPAITNIEMLIVALAPAFVLFGWLIARPSTSFVGMALSANSATLLALQSTYSADFTSFANSSLAFLLGMVAAAVVTRLARSVGADRIARRLLRTNWTTLAVAAERRGQRDRAQFTGLMLNRLALLVQRLAVMPASDRSDVARLTELRVGINIIDLRRARHGLKPATLGVMDDMLDDMARAFRAHTVGPMPPALLARVDAALAAVMEDPAPVAREDALIGLVGIRRGLFPDAEAYAPPPPASRRLAA